MVDKIACPVCGAPLKLKELSKIVICEHCGSTINLEEGSEEKDNAYKICRKRFYMITNKKDVDYVISLLEQLGDYKDSKKMYEECLLKKKQYEKKERQNKIKLIAIIVAAIIAVVACIVLITSCNGKKYNVNNIETQIISKRTGHDSYRFYVYLDYRIKNKNDSVIERIEITTNVYKNENELLGQITSTFGGYGNSGLNLKSNEEIILETYLEEYSLDKSNKMFYELYFNDLSNYRMEYKITVVEFENGKIVKD